jgi:hypothetical protein
MSEPQGLKPIHCIALVAMAKAIAYPKATFQQPLQPPEFGGGFSST